MTPTDEIERDTDRRRDRRDAAAQKAADRREDAQTARPTPVETPVQPSVASEPKPALRIAAPEDSDADATFRGDCCELRDFVAELFGRGRIKGSRSHGFWTNWPGRSASVPRRHAWTKSFAVL